jgi:hypothetical protein
MWSIIRQNSRIMQKWRNYLTKFVYWDHCTNLWKELLLCICLRSCTEEHEPRERTPSNEVKGTGNISFVTLSLQATANSIQDIQIIRRAGSGELTYYINSTWSVPWNPIYLSWNTSKTLKYSWVKTNISGTCLQYHHSAETDVITKLPLLHLEA